MSIRFLRYLQNNCDVTNIAHALIVFKSKVENEVLKQKSKNTFLYILRNTLILKKPKIVLLSKE